MRRNCKKPCNHVLSFYLVDTYFIYFKNINCKKYEYYCAYYDEKVHYFPILGISGTPGRNTGIYLTILLLFLLLNFSF